jgi:hypothetical protein
MASGFIRARSSAFDDVPRRRHQPHVQRDDIAGFKKFRLAAGRRVAIGARPRQRRIACPRHDIHTEGLAVTRDRRADAAIAKHAERFIAQGRADADLPFAGLERDHLLRQLARGCENERPGQFGGGVTRNACMLARRHDNGAARAGFDIDMRVQDTDALAARLKDAECRDRSK